LTEAVLKRFSIYYFSIPEARRLEVIIDLAMRSLDKLAEIKADSTGQGFSASGSSAALVGQISLFAVDYNYKMSDVRMCSFSRVNYST
jgi:hypothetical protein